MAIVSFQQWPRVLFFGVSHPFTSAVHGKIELVPPGTESRVRSQTFSATLRISSGCPQITSPSLLIAVQNDDTPCRLWCLLEATTVKSMGGLDSERFKIVRRNSLRNEVDGSFEDLEDFEDRNEAPAGNSSELPTCVDDRGPISTGTHNLFAVLFS